MKSLIDSLVPVKFRNCSVCLFVLLFSLILVKKIKIKEMIEFHVA